MSESNETSVEADDQDVRLTLEVERLTLAKLEATCSAFKTLLDAVGTTPSGQHSVSWDVTNISLNSPLGMTFTPVADDPLLAVAAVREFKDVTASISKGNGALSNPAFAKPARAVVNLIDADVSSIGIEVLGEDIEISGDSSVRPVVPLKSVGAIEGEILSMSVRRGLEFTLYDAVQGRAIYCRGSNVMEGTVQRLFHKKVYVAGMITRNPITGKALNMSGVTEIRPINYERASYRQARGIYSLNPDRPPLDELLKRVADAQ